MFLSKHTKTVLLHLIFMPFHVTKKFRAYNFFTLFIEDIFSLYLKCLAVHNFHNNKCLFKDPCKNLSALTVHEIYWYN